MRNITTATWIAALAVSIATLGACSDDAGNGAGPPLSEVPVTTAAPAAPASDDCGVGGDGRPLEAVASYAPDGPNPAPGAMPPGSYMADILGRGRLRVGVSGDTLLMGARNPFTGNLEGLDIDILKEVAHAIFGPIAGDVEPIEFKVITYADRLPALEEDRVDIVAHTMTINCVRWNRIDFSAQYLVAGQKILVRSDSEAKSVDDMNGTKVCAAKGSTNIDNIAAYPQIEAVGVDDLTDCLVLFQQGTVDAVTGDDTVLAGFAEQDPYAKVIGDYFTDEPYGLGIADGQVDFVKFVNRVLEDIKASGRWAEIYDKWLFSLAPDGAPLPPAPVYGRPEG